KMGPLTVGKAEEHIFLGREVSRPKDYSEETAILIDSEIKRIVTDCAVRARQLLETNLEKLYILARALLERETLDGEEINRILIARPFQEAPAPACSGVTQQREHRHGPRTSPPRKLQRLDAVARGH